MKVSYLYVVAGPPKGDKLKNEISQPLWQVWGWTTWIINVHTTLCQKKDIFYGNLPV